MPMNPTQTQVRHTAEDALDTREYQMLLEGAGRLESPRDFQARFIVLVGGRLGLRPGEIAHMDREWLNSRENMIEIPRLDPCEKGRDGGPCGYCNEMAQQMSDYNDDVTVEDALEYCWSPKTDAAARSVPYDFDSRAEIVIERFFERYPRYPHSRTSINRRVDRAAQLADEIDHEDVYPHCLRATAATFHASRGLNAVTLQAMFGWAQLSTAQKYIRKSGKATQRELQNIHSR